MKGVLKALFSFEGEMGRLSYVAATIGVLALQLLFAHAVLSGYGETTELGWFWALPFEAVAKAQTVPSLMKTLGVVVLLVTDWMLLAFAFRRARRVRFDAYAPMTIVVGLQFAAILILAVAPDADGERRKEFAEPSAETLALAQGVLVGMGLCVAAVVFEALVLRLYGYGMFMVSPFLVGAATGYLCNRRGDIGGGKTLRAVLGALLLGGFAILSVALEGVICLVFASPLIAFMGIIGGLAGRSAALHRMARKSRLMSVALTPILLAAELLTPPHAEFDNVQSVEVAAPPQAVWNAVVHMGPIPDAPAAPFRWGLAYPVRGVIRGEGVGAVREGVFSTGVAYERVTKWEPGRRLEFIVLSDPPTMRELSPYREVHAPHTIGYFKTRDARFAITPLANGWTRLTLSTRHEVDLAPAIYWMPFVDWAVHANKVRVLNHFRRQAEAASA